MRFKFLIFLWLVTCSLLLIYSFSQLDLNLTLSSHSVYQSFQQQLTYLGYFNRPLSTAIYIFIVLLLAISYWLLHRSKLRLLAKSRLNLCQFWLAVLATVIILFPSYPAFSH